VINVAGITGANQSLEKTAPKDFRRLIETHLFGTYNVCHFALPLLKQQETGVIINFSSLFALRAMPNYIGYNAAKTAIISLTETMALELAPSIRVNAVAPGFIDTPMTQSNPNYNKLVEMVETTYPLQKGGNTAHVVDTILFLMRNDFMTGETIAISGGAHL
ncbi:MAG TPA: NAD(P)-dependent oxidoreductase, partial [Firmicutes bacterium]|nr:NAD(P)-dependent oxidoreductase [Bacillota bacterium]